MSLLNQVSRLFALVAAVAMLLPAFVHAEGGYYFQSPDGSATLSDVRVELWDPGDGDYVVKITFTPSQAEMDALLRQGSHVDLKVSFFGLEQSIPETDFAISASDYIRYIGAEVDSASVDPVFWVHGLNIDGRWIAGKTITITTSVYGYQPSGSVRPSVAVDLISSYWSFEKDGCEVVFERTTNGVTDRFCVWWSQQAPLVGPYRDSAFPF